jgi:hypothetical protein
LAEAACDRGTQTSKRLCRTASRTEAATSVGGHHGQRPRARQAVDHRCLNFSRLHDGERHAAPTVLEPQRFSQADHACLVAEYVALPGGGTRQVFGV